MSARWPDVRRPSLSACSGFAQAQLPDRTIATIGKKATVAIERQDSVIRNCFQVLDDNGDLLLQGLQCLSVDTITLELVGAFLIDRLALTLVVVFWPRFPFA